jgi:catechol 2,3-dioxygenase-like lactoylglutathione lyase family enzyme
MNTFMKHIALFVPDLQLAERYYQTVFDMELVGREAELADGLWYTLPFDKGWDDAVGVGIQLGMVALRKDEFVLALFRGDAPQGQVFAIGITMPAEEIARVRTQLPRETVLCEGESDFIEFRDIYGISWQVSNQGSDFRTAGTYADRWLQLE